MSKFTAQELSQKFEIVMQDAYHWISTRSVVKALDYFKDRSDTTDNNVTSVGGRVKVVEDVLNAESTPGYVLTKDTDGKIIGWKAPAGGGGSVTRLMVEADLAPRGLSRMSPMVDQDSETGEFSSEQTVGDYLDAGYLYILDEKTMIFYASQSGQTVGVNLKTGFYRDPVTDDENEALVPDIGWSLPHYNKLSNSSNENASLIKQNDRIYYRRDNELQPLALDTAETINITPDIALVVTKIADGFTVALSGTVPSGQTLHLDYSGHSEEITTTATTIAGDPLISAYVSVVSASSILYAMEINFSSTFGLIFGKTYKA